MNEKEKIISLLKSENSNNVLLGAILAHNEGWSNDDIFKWLKAEPFFDDMVELIIIDKYIYEVNYSYFSKKPYQWKIYLYGGHLLESTRSSIEAINYPSKLIDYALKDFNNETR